MKENQQIKDTNLRRKAKPTFLEKMAYSAKYLQLRYGVSQYFIYLIFVFVVIGIFIFFGMLNMS
jgi:hypothetical protein